MRLEDNDLKPSVSSQLLIKDEMPNPTVMPKFTYLYECSTTKNVFLGFSSNRTI